MTAVATLPVLLQTGNHAGRPAASAVGSGALYNCTTHGLIYQQLAGSWGTWLTLPAAGFADPMTSRGDIIVRNASNVTARLAKGGSGTYLGSDGTDVGYAAVTDAQLSTSDITTNNASTSKHGFLKKLSNSATDYMDGTGNWSTPAGGGGGSAVLGATQYSSGSDSAWKTTSSANSEDIDATNAALTITIPASGNIVVAVSFMYGVSYSAYPHYQGYCDIKNGSTVIGVVGAFIVHGNVAISPAIAAAVGGWFNGICYITGLTPGSMTIKAAMRTTSYSPDTTIAYAYDGLSGHINPPFKMIAWAA